MWFWSCLTIVFWVRLRFRVRLWLLVGLCLCSTVVPALVAVFVVMAADAAAIIEISIA